MDGLTLTYLIIGGLSLVLLLVAVVVGDIGDLGHPDADGIFSLPAIAAFFGGGGFAAAIAASLLDGAVPEVARLLLSLGIGAVVAVPLAWGAIRLSASLMRMRTDATLSESDLLGAQGVLVTAVASASHFGEARLIIGGQPVKMNARSASPLPVGTPVYVVEVLSATSVEVVSTAADPFPGRPSQPSLPPADQPDRADRPDPTDRPELTDRPDRTDRTAQERPLS